MPLRCDKCDGVISCERIESYLDASGKMPGTCIACANSINRNIGFMVYPHKTGGDVVVIDPNNREAIRQARRAYRRSR